MSLFLHFIFLVHFSPSLLLQPEYGGIETPLVASHSVMLFTDACSAHGTHRTDRNSGSVGVFWRTSHMSNLQL